METALRQAAAALDGSLFALVGGLAVGVRGEPRMTRDVDLAVAVQDDAAAEDLVFRLQAGGWAVLALLEQERTGRLATIRLAPPDRNAKGRVVVDLLFASSGIESEIAHGAERLEVLPGLTVPVARRGDLIAMKVLARDDAHRPKDLQDLRGLLAVATPDDVQLAREALGLIAARGFDRGRPLLTEFESLLPSPIPEPR